MTGGNPKTTGIYYDDSFNRALYPAEAVSQASCTGLTKGAEVTYFEQAAKDLTRLDSGQGLSGLPATIMALTSNATSLIDPNQLPRDANCNPVYPHSYLKVNTIMEVAHAKGLLTAWSDKHAAYEIFNGNSGTGVTDYFTPEINSLANVTAGAGDQDWTKDNMLTRMYDTFKVDAVVNEINGLDHSGTIKQGVPAIFGMNFQTVSTAEKLPNSSSSTPRVALNGGYVDNGNTPGPLLQEALAYIDTQVGRMVAAINASGLQGSTVVVLSAKHGQSPQDGSKLTRIKDSTVIGQLNAAWKAAHPGAADLVVFSINDDGMLIWLDPTQRSQAAADWAKSFLLAYHGDGTGKGTDTNPWGFNAIATDINGNPKPYTQAGLATIYAGQDAANFMGVPYSDERVPDVIGVAQVGTVYTGGQGKIAEHGGNNPQDKSVPILVSGGSVGAGGTDSTAVETTQIAPTILQLLGLNPNQLAAVRSEHTQTLALP
jgi:hypothetical protein